MNNRTKFVIAIFALLALITGLYQPANAVSPETTTVSFSVYFKEDSTSLTAAAKSILRENYNNYAAEIVSISIRGYVRAAGDGKRFIKCATSRAKTRVPT